jgi:rubrerythrin
LTKLKGTKTEKNLWEAFAGESMARNKYTYFAKVAKKEGYEQISDIFMETAENEKEHAKLWFKALEELGDTMENLKHAAEGEHEEATSMYPRMAKEAKEEGFKKIAFLFEKVGEIEDKHEARYKQLLQNIEEGQVFERKEKKVWKCRNCGYLHEGENALGVCPVCDHPQAFFEIKSNNY